MVSVNKEALKVVNQFLADPEYFNVKVEKLPCGATVIDTGVEVASGYLTGLKLIEIAMGGLGTATLTFMDYDGLMLPTVVVTTDYPAISLLGSQLAGWTVKAEGFHGFGSGPARALALKPKRVFEKIKYKDQYDSAVLLLETEMKPTNEAALEVSKMCNVKPENLYLVLTTSNTLAGSVQVSGRVVETGLYRLDFLGFDPLKVVYAVGFAPVMPPHPDPNVSVSREEDALIYGGSSQYIVDFENEEKLKEFSVKAPATTWPEYGKTSYEALKAVNFDWSKLDPSFFAIGAVTIVNRRTGKVLASGKIYPEMIKKSLT